MTSVVLSALHNYTLENAGSRHELADFGSAYFANVDSDELQARGPSWEGVSLLVLRCMYPSLCARS